MPNIFICQTSLQLVDKAYRVFSFLVGFFALNVARIDHNNLGAKVGCSKKLLVSSIGCVAT